MSLPSLCFNSGCSNPGTKRCSRCHGLFFCGRDCQIAQWKWHKSLCRAVAKEPKATCLLLDGMGPLGPGEFYTKNVQAALGVAGVKVVTLDLYKGGDRVFEQVASLLLQVDRFQSCIALGVGSGGTDLETEFGQNQEFQKAIVAWVNKGGRFLVQGELAQSYGNWPAWFEKTWKNSDYRRTDHVCGAKSDDDVHWCKWYHRATGSITGRYNVKAVMMKEVAPEDRLFHTTGESKSHSLVPMMAGVEIDEGQCAIALGKFGEGSVSFFGDVNAEEDTCSIMAIIARGN